SLECFNCVDACTDTVSALHEKQSKLIVLEPPQCLSANSSISNTTFFFTLAFAISIYYITAYA
ncbi:MAG TPA: hypothetical protein PLN22_14770, partial [Ignavibacteria bacterium]|nr:hypothetical protein [Ignavibacteria bacterium]